MAITANPSVQNGSLITGQGTKTFLNITTPTVVKTVAGRVARVNVLVAGSANGTINDAATTGAVATSNEIAVIPDVIGSYSYDFPCANGIVVTPGTGQTLAISFI